MVKKYKVNEKFNNKTITDFLIFYHLASSKRENLFKDKSIKINNIVSKNTSIIKTDDIIEITYQEEIDFLILKQDIDIIYEDEYFLIINKPLNIIVHPDSKEKNGTLTNMVAYYFEKNNINSNIRYVHRLDEETTGIIMFTKDALTQSYMNHLFSLHEVKRIYLALCGGIFTLKEGTINAKIGEDRHHNKRRRISKTGQDAITNYEVIKEFKNYSLVKLSLETGRTHQIRVHMQSIGHSLLGDELYSGNMKEIKRVALHSAEIVFYHPYNFKIIHLESKLPFDMQKLVNKGA